MEAPNPVAYDWVNVHVQDFVWVDGVGEGRTKVYEQDACVDVL